MQNTVKQVIVKNNITNNQQLAEVMGYQTVETTTARNGYPENTETVITANSISELNAIKTNLTKEGFYVSCLQLHRRDGWGLWHRSNIPFFELGHFLEGANYFIDVEPNLTEDDLFEILFEEVTGNCAPDNYPMLKAWAERIEAYASEIGTVNHKTRFYLNEADQSIEYSVSEDASAYSNDTHNYCLAITVDLNQE